MDDPGNIIVPAQEIKHELDESKFNRLMEGAVEPFPGNISLMEYFDLGFRDGRISKESVALCEEREHTFQELHDASTVFAEALREMVKGTRNNNPDADTVFGICMPPSEKMIFIIFAVMKLGAAYVPFEASFPEERINLIVKTARPLAIICENNVNTIKKFENVKSLAKVISFKELLDAADLMQKNEETCAFSNFVEPLIGPQHLYERAALILFTSGSSGEPKGVRLCHKAVMNRLNWQWKTFPFESKEKCVFKTSLTFVDSVSEIFSPLLQGKSVMIFSRTYTTNPNLFVNRLHSFAITRLVLVPSLLKAIFDTIKLIGKDEGKALLSTVKLWVCSGETLTKNLLETFFEIFPMGYTIANFYGSTEVMGDVTYISYSSKMEVYEKTLPTSVPIGESIFNTVLYLMNEELNLVKKGDIGEIYIAGYNLAKGYVGKKDQEKFLDNPYTKTFGYNDYAGFTKLFRTGDFARIIEKNKRRFLVFEGRADSQVKVRGQKVDLNEIELILSTIHLVSKVRVLCKDPGTETQAIIAFIVPTKKDSMYRIKDMMQKKLTSSQMPLVHQISELPLLVNGKTDRQKLLRDYQQSILEGKFQDWGTLGIPQNKVVAASTLVQILAQVIGVSTYDIASHIDESFFSVGGSSLNSVVVIVRLREKGFEISIRDFVSAPTIRSILKVMQPIAEKEETADKESPIGQLESGEDYFKAPVTDNDEEDFVKILSYSFSKKGDLEVYTGATYDEFVRLLTSMWRPIVTKGYSFIVRRIRDGSAVGVSLNFDVYDEPTNFDASPAITYVFEVLEIVEGRQRERLPKGKGKLFHSFMMGTAEEVNASENVFLIGFMEEHIIQMAKSNHFIGILTTNTNPLTQQIGEVHGYEVLSTYQVNQYTGHDKSQPFLLAPDSFKVVCSWKRLSPNIDEEKDL